MNVTDEQVERALAAYYANRGGSDNAYIRANFTEDMRAALTAALSSPTPEQGEVAAFVAAVELVEAAGWVVLRPEQVPVPEQPSVEGGEVVAWRYRETSLHHWRGMDCTDDDAASGMMRLLAESGVEVEPLVRQSALAKRDAEIAEAWAAFEHTDIPGQTLAGRAMQLKIAAVNAEARLAEAVKVLTEIREMCRELLLVSPPAPSSPASTPPLPPDGK